jgi:uncharacterized membrane protein YfcA
VTQADWIVAVLTGFGAGVLSGAFGVGGGIIMTPAISAIMGVPGNIALFTPLPVIIPTAMTGASRYWKAGQVDVRAAKLVALPGAAGALVGALATEYVPARWLLIATALVLAWQSVRVIRGSDTAEREAAFIPGWQFVVTGLVAGLVSGLLGIGGGLVMVPVFASILGMPLKRALGTSLFVMPALALVAAIQHIILGNVDWAIAVGMMIGVVPGAMLGARLALRAKDKNLRIAVGSFMFGVAVLYGATQVFGSGA